MIINFLVTASVCGIYSQAMKSRVEVLSEHDQNQDQNQNDEEMQTQPRNNNLTEKKLFKAYCLQLLTRFFSWDFICLSADQITLSSQLSLEL